MTDHEPRSPLAVRGVSKRFGSVQALSRISLRFAAGEVHAILGENGAGKSTLMNILSGGSIPDDGEVRVDDRAVRFSSPRAARQAGIGMVHQHFTLVEALTVAENLALAFSPPGAWRYDAAEAASQAEALARRVGLALESPHRVVRELPVGSRQRLEILKALAGSVRVLILDEPTAVLTPQETEQLFAILTRLRSEGCTVIFITHKLREAMSLADRISILRRGELVGTFASGELDENALAEQMVGQLHPFAPPQRVSTGTAPVLELIDIGLSLEGQQRLTGVRLAVAAGEIAAIAGVDGNGQTELFELLAGTRAASQGHIRIAGQPLKEASPQAAITAGIGHIPPDRQREGLVLSMSIADNCLLARKLLDRFSTRGFLDRERVRDHAESVVRDYEVRVGSLDDPVRALSGGNQQRIVVGRELAQTPKVLVTVNPTRGLDIAASRAVGDALRAAAARGCGILLISTDLDEVLSLGNSVRVLSSGRLSAPLYPPVDVARLGLLMAGAAR